MIEVGDIVKPSGIELGTFVPRATHDARQAAAAALTAYLRRIVFIRYGNDRASDVRFKLCGVYDNWPDPQQTLEYPSASVTDTNVMGMLGHNLVPSALESTWNVYAPNAMLWKISEISYTFQVDFWCQTPADREAVASALPGAFAPGEGRANVVLAGDDRYFCLPVRASLEGYQRMDTPKSAYELESRLMSQVRCDVDVVELRCATALEAEIHLRAQDGNNVTQSTQSGACISGG